MATECTEWPLVVLQWQAVLERTQQRWRCCLQRSLTAWRSQAARHLGSTQGLTDARGHAQLNGMPKTRGKPDTGLSETTVPAFRGICRGTNHYISEGSQEVTHCYSMMCVMHPQQHARVTITFAGSIVTSGFGASSTNAVSM